MLITRLQRAQVQLQTHQTWLRSFVASHTHTHIHTHAAAAASANANGAFQPTRPTRRAFTVRRVTEPEQGARPTKKEKTSRKKSNSKSNFKSNSKSEHPSAGFSDADLQELSRRADLLEAVADQDLDTAISRYAALPEKKLLNEEDVKAVAQLTSIALRTARFAELTRKTREDIDKIMMFAAQLANDIQNYRLVPSTHAHVHLLVAFKESDSRDTGIEFWKWLETQDETYVSPEVYAVAIELLAKNGTPLPELEQLYQTALARFPGTFTAYHYSPDAVLPNREAQTNIGAMPSHLLRAIALARLVRGDSRGAYLALDTQLRLFPHSTDPQFVQPFLDERPITETYTVCAMACRGGIALRNSSFKSFIPKIRHSSDFKSVAGHIAVLRAIVATTYLHLGAGGRIPRNAAIELIIAITHIFRLPGFEDLAAPQRKRLADSVLEAIRKAMQVLSRYGAIPTATAFNAIISNVAGLGQMKSVIGRVLADMRTLRLEENMVTKHCILVAAGKLKDAPLVMETWQSICSEHESNNTVPSMVAWRSLIPAAKLAGCAAFAQSELDRFVAASKMDPAVVPQYLQKHLDNDDTVVPAPHEPLDADALIHGIDKLRADLTFFEEQTRDKPASLDFSNQILPSTLVPIDDSLTLPEPAMRKIYDELTTDPTSQKTEPRPAKPNSRPDDPRLSVTNVSLGVLRYENWKATNYLLWQAERHDRAFAELVEKAIAEGRPPPQRVQRLTRDVLESMASFGLSEAREEEEGEEEVSEERFQRVRGEILRLRRRA